MVASILSGLFGIAGNLFGDSGLAVEEHLAMQSSRDLLTTQLRSAQSTNELNEKVVAYKTDSDQKALVQLTKFGVAKTMGDLMASALGKDLSIARSNLGVVDKAMGG